MSIIINYNDGKTLTTMTGGETTVDFDFPIFDATHLEVYETDLTGTVTTLVKDTDYTVPAGSVDQQAGGTINLDGTQYPSGATAGHVFTIYQAAPYARTTDFNQAGDFLAETLNEELDLLTQQNQQIRRDLGRALLVNVDTALTDLTLPTPDDGKALIWDGTTGAIENSTFNMEDLSGAAVAAAASAAAAAASETNAATSETNAATHEDTAEDWATKTDGIVEATDYSSKAYAIGGTGITNAAGAAKEWATKAEDSTVDGVNYSAYHWAQKAEAIVGSEGLPPPEVDKAGRIIMQTPDDLWDVFDPAAVGAQLTSNGPDSPLSWIMPAIRYRDSFQMSSTTEIIIPSSLLPLGKYTVFKLRDVVHSGASCNIHFYLSTDNGSSWISGYRYLKASFDTGGTSLGIAGSSSSSSIPILGSSSTAIAAPGFSGELTFLNLGSPGTSNYWGRSEYPLSTSTAGDVSIQGSVNKGAPINAIRVLTSINTLSGTLSIFTSDY